MHITITKRILGKMTEQDLKTINRDYSNIKSLDRFTVNLSELSESQITDLRNIFVRLKNTGTNRMGILISDIDLWCHVVEKSDSSKQKPRTLEQFSDLLVEYIRTSPGHRIYEKQKESNDWLVYYVNYIEYEHERRSTREYDYVQAHVVIHLLYWMLGKQYSHKIILYNDDVDGQTIGQALANRGLFTETKELHDNYIISKNKFDKVFPQVGKQYTTIGYGTSIDSRHSNFKTPMMRDGVPAKVVIDIANEQGENSSGNNYGMIRTNFWLSRKPQSVKSDDSNDLWANRTLLDKDDVGVIGTNPEVPIHPYVPIYHLSRHQRYKVTVMDLEEYVFNKSLGEQLVLPDITKNLVDVLVSQGRVSFQDIIEGKGSGVCVLLTGPPGVGKTLTAEVFSEATERPLLSVQAAQLGVSPDNIEKNLLNVLQRGSRWNAVVLIDEADVYINERGTNMQQNAIVAAFLRILENHTATIFLTTNHMENVDDAVASRCIARIDYEKPDLENQRNIWNVLNILNNVGLTELDIDRITEIHNDLSGRDIKQIIKLASMWSSSHDKPVDIDTISFVKEFLPTRVYKSLNRNGKLSNMFEFDKVNY